MRGIVPKTLKWNFRLVFEDARKIIKIIFFDFSARSPAPNFTRFLIWQTIRESSKKEENRVFCFFGISAPARLQKLAKTYSGYSAVRLAHLLWEQGVVGSNPTTPTSPTIVRQRRTTVGFLFI
jgi:hypothetical protein